MQKPLEEKTVPKNNKFRFEIQPSKLRKLPRKILENERLIYEMIRVNNGSTKSVYRGILYNNLFILNNLFINNYGLINFGYSWYVNSQVFSYIHDVCSITTPPDYSIKKLNAIDSNSVSCLCEMLKDYSRSLGIKRISHKKYYCISEWFIVYLHRLKNSNNLGLKYSRDENFRGTYNVCNKDWSYKILTRLIDMLVDNNLCLAFTGNVLYGTRSMSMIVVNEEIYDLLGITGNIIEVSTKPKTFVIVTDNDKNIVDHTKLGDDVIKLVDDGVRILDKYSECMDNHVISVNGYLIPEHWLKRVLKVEKETCGRIFDNGSVQGKSKLVRSMITIDEISTISLDFKAIHPAILLYKEGYKLKNHDPYPSLDYINVDSKLINKFKKFYDIDNYNPVRNIVKKLFLCMINADSISNAVGSCYDDLHKDNLKKGTFHEHTMKYIGLPSLNLHLVAEKILNHNHMIAKYLGKGVGNKLQYQDSCLILQSIDVLTDMNIPALPVHDCLICKETDEDIVRKVMTESFLSVVGYDAIDNCIIELE
jgi:hypothetical protein